MTALPLLDDPQPRTAPATLGLPFDFPLMTPGLSVRPPYAIELDEIRVELNREHAQRARFYSVQVGERKLTQAEADKRRGAWMAVMRLMGCELDATDASWRAMVAELRREILMRRNVYPGRIDARRMTREDAAARMEAIEAAHWHLWIMAEGWTLTDADRAPGSAWSKRTAMTDLRAHADNVFAWEVAGRAAGNPAARPLSMFAVPAGYHEPSMDMPATSQ